jgi:hypothetical protein
MFVRGALLREDRYAVQRRCVQVFVFARRQSATALKTATSASLKSPGVDPFCGTTRAAATHTIQPRHDEEMYGTARTSFTRADHARFTDLVISSAAS